MVSFAAIRNGEKSLTTVGKFSILDAHVGSDYAFGILMVIFELFLEYFLKNDCIKPRKQNFLL